MTKGTLLLSPHSDDAVMSSFGIVTRKLLPEPIRLLTTFSWTDFLAKNQRTLPGLRALLNLVPRPSELVHSVTKNAGRFGTDPRSVLNKVLDLGTPYKTSRIRVLEDMSFSRRMGICFSYMNFPCSNVRHHRVILDAEQPLEESALEDQLFSSLRDMVLRAEAEAVVSPWPYASRQHVDHRLVHEAAKKVAESTRTRLFYVDDQPYSRRPVKPMSDSRGLQYSPVVVKLDSSEMARKLRAMKIYWSQMTPVYLRSVCLPPPGSPDLVCSETLWEST